jgi:hypothetical protein
MNQLDIQRGRVIVDRRWIRQGNWRRDKKRRKWKMMMRRVLLKSLEDDEWCELMHQQAFGDEKMAERSPGEIGLIPMERDVGI